MTEAELITVTIDHYDSLQRIKQANGDHENPVLDHDLQVTKAKLATLGVNVEDITLK